MDERISSVKKIGGGGVHSRHKQSITLVALFLVLAIVTLVLVGCSEGSSSSSSGGGGVTPPVTPTLASLSNVQIQPAGNDGTLSLRWQAPSEATQVVVKATSTAPAQVIQVRIPAIEYRALFQQGQSYKLKGLQALTNYTVEIEAQKDTEVSPKTTRTVTTLIDTTTPQDTLTQVGVEKSGDGIKITWDKERLASGRTDIAEATIVVKSTTGATVLAQATVQNLQQGEVTLPNISTLAGISYDIEIRYKDRNDNTSSPTTVLTGVQASALSQTVAALPEADLTVTANDKSNSPADESLLVTWGSFAFGTGSTAKSLLVRVTATATQTIVAEEKIDKDTSATNVSSATAQTKEYATVYVAKDGIALTTLYGTLTYKVEVYVSQNGKYSTAVSKELATTDKTTKPATNVSAVGGATSIVVIWQAPNVRDYAGVTITATEKDSDKVAKTVTITDRAVRNTQIIGLKATTEYTVAVQSQDYAGNKGTEATTTVDTGADSTAPDPVTNIQASYPFVSATKVGTQITWTAPDATKAKNKDIKEYSISIQEKDTTTAVVSEKKIAYPTTSLSVEELSQGKTYTVTIQAIDYSENKSNAKTQDITTPTPLTAPSAELFQSKPALVTTTGAIQIKATFTQAPGSNTGSNKYYTLRMYDSTTLVAEKSITNPATTISFGIADGIEVSATQANAKQYSFTFLTVENNRVSPPTTLTDKVAVYDAISTVPPAPKSLTLLIAESTATSDTVQYEFQAGTITDNHKAPNDRKLKPANIQYKVYIVAGDQSTKTIAEIKAIAGVQTQDIAINSTLRGTFIGTKGAVYTIGIEAINSLNPSTTKKAQSKDPALIQTLALSTIPRSKATAPTSSLANTLVVSQSTNTTGTIKLVLTQLSTITGAKNKDGTTVTSNDELVYTVYGLQKDTTPTVAEVQKGRKVTIGTARNGVYTVPELSSIGVTSPTVAIKGATKYHFVVEVAIKTDPSKKAVSTVATVTTASQATDPAEVSNIQVKGVEGRNAKLSWTAPSLTASHKTDTGDTLAVAQVSYKVYKVAKSGSTQRTIAEIIIAAGGSPTTVAAGTTNSTLTSVTVGTTYEIVVQAVNSTDPNKESRGIRKEFIAKEAYGAPGKPTIQANAQGATIVLTITAPTVKGTAEDGTTTLRDNQIDYKVYYVASNTSINGATVKTQAQRASDAQVGAEKDDVPTGATSYTIRNLRLNTKYYITAVAVNSLKKTKISAEATAVSASTPTVVIGNATKLSATVGSALAQNTTRVLTSISPSGLSFTCDESTIDNDNSTLKQETGLTVSFAKNTNTVTITGTANKSNIHDTAITEYSYGVVECTITSAGANSGQKVLATINVETGLVKLAGQSANYYRPTTKTALQAIITAEKTRQGSGGNSNPSPNLNMIDTSAITDMSDLFDRDSTFNGDITKWNTSNVTDMSGIFFQASVFNQDIGDWDVENVTNMKNMFIQASAFNKDIGNWKVGNVTNIGLMFFQASAFDQDLSSWKLCKISRIDIDNFFGSAIADKTAWHPKDKTDTVACPSS